MTTKRSGKSKKRQGLAKSHRSAIAAAFCVTIIGGFAFAVSQLNGVGVGEIALTAEKVEKMRAFQSRTNRKPLFRKNSDAVTRDGVRGHVDIDKSTGRLVMELTDRHGAPIDNAHVVARVTEPDKATSSGQKMLLKRGKGAEYAADLNANRSGAWVVAVTATDHSSDAGNPFLFHIEKTFQVGSADSN